MQIVFDRLYKRIGKVTIAAPYSDLSNPKKVVGPEFGVILGYPKLRFLEIEAKAESEDSNRPASPFAKGFEAVESLYASFQRDASAVLLPKERLLSGRLRRDQPLHLSITINTDDPEFKKFADEVKEDDETGHRSGRLKIAVILVAQQGNEEPVINLVLSPCTAPPSYSGFVAIDLGNTNSTLAALKAGVAKREQSDQIQVLPDDDYKRISAASLHKSHPPVVSIIRVESALNVEKMSVEEQTKALALPEAITWQIGKSVRREANSKGVVVGPKRWVARPKGGHKFHLAVANRESPDKEITVPIDNWVPAELLVCRLLQGFQAIERQAPEQVAITYPTGYSSRELRQLREAVYRAMLRLRRQLQDNISASAMQNSIPLALDEASAAAFFFLHRKIFEPPGGLRRFRYLYPRGFNLLLYDCGGGTTDIALVRAESATPDTLTVSVLGRAALRDFGGDDVSIAIFQLLKAKLSHLLMTSADRPRDVSRADKLPAMPRGDGLTATSIDKYLKDNANSFDMYVPTRFRAGGASVDDLQCQQRAVALWEWAERIKAAFSKGQTEVRDCYARDALTTTLASPPNDTKKRNQIHELQQGTSISRAEVDLLVKHRFEDSVTLCNNLIQDKLHSKFDDDEVHLVCLAGNGSRYPLVQELLRNNLTVAAGGDDDWFLVDSAHLKHAVAKGAVLALEVQKAGHQMNVTFDQYLHERLPFDVGYRDDSMNSAKLLFAEGEKYSKYIEPKTMAGPTSADSHTSEREHRQQFIYLERRWPGEGGRWLPFLQFRFKNPIEGPVEVCYDEQKQDFVVTHNGEVAQRQSDESGLAYLAPVQRGTL